MNSERRNLTQPADWWAAFEAQAATEGKTLSEWAGECMLANVDSKLSERPPAHRPKRCEDCGSTLRNNGECATVACWERRKAREA
jgi:hypothetical protein